jgi:hypothetical protein
MSHYAIRVVLNSWNRVGRVDVNVYPERAKDDTGGIEYRLLLKLSRLTPPLYEYVTLIETLFRSTSL